MNEAHKWLKDGADLMAGHRLFLALFPKNRAFAILLEHDRNHFKQHLYNALSAVSDAPKSLIEEYRRFYAPVPVKLRQEFKFLNSSDCPSEYKILVHDRISAYHRYTSAHQQLGNCVTLDECFETARIVIEAFRENRLIFEELSFYEHHRHSLGKHPIFRHQGLVKELKELNPKELFAKERQLRHNIWRIETEITKNNRPDLLESRTKNLKAKRELLDEVQKLISLYD